jgi:hypothetical protein
MWRSVLLEGRAAMRDFPLGRRHATGSAGKEDTMKLRALIRMLLAAIVVLAAASTAGAGKKQQPSKPFWGNSVGEVHWEYSVGECPSQQGFFTVSEAEGQLTHLGRAATTSRHCAGGDGLPLYGTAVFTAANGDEVRATYAAGTFHVTTFAPPLLVEEGEYTITGGTGRFQNASGTLNVTVFLTMVDFPPGPSSHWPAEFVFVGTISY